MAGKTADAAVAPQAPLARLPKPPGAPPIHMTMGAAIQEIQNLYRLGYSVDEIQQMTMATCARLNPSENPSEGWSVESIDWQIARIPKVKP